MYKVSLQPIAAVRLDKKQVEYSKPTGRYIAVVNEESGEVVSVVSNKYKLLKNSEALNIAKMVFSKLFPSVEPDEFVPFKVIAPSTKASCHIDLIHKDVKLSEINWEQDTWYPFLRMANSYNHSKVFSIEIGFVRKLCSNGVIFNSDTVEIKFDHDQLNIEKIGFKVERLKQHEKAFVEHISRLKEQKMDFTQLTGLVCRALRLHFDIHHKDQMIARREKERLEKMRKVLTEIAEFYVTENEKNAYSLFGIMTDFVSHQDTNKVIRGFSVHPNVYYKRVGEWSKEFAEEIKSKSFNMEEYLQGYDY